MMTTITRWVLAHKRIVSTFWILVTLVGIATVSQSTKSFSTQFSVPGREGFETNVAIGRLYREGGQNAPLLAVVTLPHRNVLVSSPAAAGRLRNVAAKFQRALPGVSAPFLDRNRAFISVRRSHDVRARLPAPGSRGIRHQHARGGHGDSRPVRRHDRRRARSM